jgi:hypothetical protein
LIDKALFSHKYEDVAFGELELLAFEKQLAFNYGKYTQSALLPDLYGKTVKVSALQFGDIHKLSERLAALLEMPVPDIYVYENFYYTVESKGLENNWIEVSAKTLIELAPEDFVFLLAKEMCAIKYRHTYYYTIIEEALNASNLVSFPGLDTIQKTGKVRLYKWVRMSHYTSDNFAYLVCADISVCVNAIVKTVLNNVFLARHVNVAEFLRQAERINALTEDAHKYSKMEEQMPYAPYRIKNLMAYASSARGIQALRELNEGKEGIVCSS